jgi:hypothetical protein
VFKSEIETRPREEVGVLRARHHKLQKDFRVVHDHYEQIRARAIERLQHQPIQNFPTGATMNKDMINGETNQEIDVRERISVQDTAINEEILREREQEIREIHHTVTKVNEVFKDLADLVNEQQQEIDAVQAMIDRSHQHAQSGLHQVEKVGMPLSASLCVPTSTFLHLNSGQRNTRVNMYDVVNIHVCIPGGLERSNHLCFGCWKPEHSI